MQYGHILEIKRHRYTNLQLQTQKSSTESMQTTMITANKDKHGQWHTTTDGSRMSTAYIVSESLRSSFSSCWMTVESRWYCSARLCRPSIMLLSDRNSSTSVNASLMSRSTWRPLINNADSPAARPSADSKYYKVHTASTVVCNDIMMDTHDSTWIIAMSCTSSFRGSDGQVSWALQQF